MWEPLSENAVAATKDGQPHAFNGAWCDTEGTVVKVSDDMMYGPDGGKVAIETTGVSTCRFQVDGETYEGKLGSDGSLEWNDGAV